MNGNLAIPSKVFTDEEKRAYVAAGQRPTDISKREWKSWKRQFREVENKPQFVHPYPFSQEEIGALASFGVDVPEIDYMVGVGYSREDVLKLIGRPDETEDETLYDLPVHDRRWAL
jgi:hypothetical protein